MSATNITFLTLNLKSQKCRLSILVHQDLYHENCIISFSHFDFLSEKLPISVAFLSGLESITLDLTIRCTLNRMVHFKIKNTKSSIKLLKICRNDKKKYVK